MKNHVKRIFASLLITQPVMAFDIHTGVNVPDVIHTDSGTIEWSAEFEDKRGHNIIYVSHYTAPFEFGTREYKEELRIKHYLYTGPSWESKPTHEASYYWEEQWGIRDFAHGGLSSLSFEKDKVRICDLNNDSIVEIEFFNTKDFDGGDPSVLKYMLMYKNKKYAIRGTLPASSDIDEYSKDIDHAYDEVNPEITEHASKTWDEFASEYFKKYLPGLSFPDD